MGNIAFSNSLQNIKDVDILPLNNCPDKQVIPESLEITGIRVYHEPDTDVGHDSKEWYGSFSEVLTRNQKVKLIPVSKEKDMLQITFLLEDLEKEFASNGFHEKVHKKISDSLSNRNSKCQKNEISCHQQILLEQSKDIINSKDQINHPQGDKLRGKELIDKFSFGSIGDACGRASVSTETNTLLTSSMATQTCLKETKNFKMQTESVGALDTDIAFSSSFQSQTRNVLPKTSCYAQTEICQQSETDLRVSCTAERLSRGSLIVNKKADDTKAANVQQATTSETSSQTEIADIFPVEMNNPSTKSKRECLEKATLTDYESSTILNFSEGKVVNLKNNKPKVVASHSKLPALLGIRSFRRSHQPIFPCRFYRQPTLRRRKNNIKAPKRYKSLVFTLEDLDSTNIQASSLNPALTRDVRKHSPVKDVKSFPTNSLIHAECMRNTSVSERVNPLGMVKLVPECTIKSFNLVRSYPVSLIINPACFKFVEYPTTEEHDIEYTRSVDCLETQDNAEDGSVSCSETQANTAVGSFLWDRNTISDSTYTEEIESTFRTVIFCQKSHAVTETDRHFMVSLCDDCYLKTWLAADEYLTMESISMTSEYSKKDPSSIEWSSISEARTHQFECKSSEIIGTDGSSLPAESPIENLQPFCEVVNNCLLNLSHEDEDLMKESISVLNQRWLTVVKDKYLKTKEVYGYLQYFQTFSDELVIMVLNFTDSEDNNALHYAYGNNRFDMAAEILYNKHGSDLLMKKNKLGHTPLMICATSQPESDEDWIIVRKSFKLGNINEVSSHCGRTALMSAASRGSSAMVRMLLDSGANPNLQDNDGSTALMYATEQGCKECVILLLEHPDCDPFLKDQDGQTALSIAKATGHKDIEQQIHLRTKKIPCKARRQAIKNPKNSH